MLVLTRKKQETLVIDGRIKITLLEGRTGRAKLGIDAPDDVSIVRGELLEKIGKPQLAGGLQPIH